ncbi:cytochrome P450 [Mycena pura]|uniref:Cytochrome P450 n=1 Tax=Mycena pura TaxID=153505 RepID=A0AAD6Y564_9AGAR|nr:cytochrome P450 [Mycena pura]
MALPFHSPTSLLGDEFTSIRSFLMVTFLAAGALFVASRAKPSPVAKIPGPSSPSWIFGNLLQLVFPRIYGEFEFEWQKTYGPVYRIKGVFGEDRLMVSDPVALQRITNDRSFIRVASQRKMGQLVFGEGSVFCIEGEQHRRLRAALSPAFSPAVVRSFSPIFAEVAQRIVHEWDKACSAGSPVRIDVCEVLDRATLDIISEAALGSPLNTVENPQHPLAQSHLKVLSAAFGRTKNDLIVDVIVAKIPSLILHALVLLPSAAFRALRNFRGVTDRMSSRLLREKTELQQSGLDQSNDMLGILITGISDARKKNMTADELAEQIRLILLAGQDTSANALAWCLYELAKDGDYQQKLRAEIQMSRGSARGMDYDSMPLLNALLKETLRVYPAAAYMDRVASEDSVIPLAYEITTTAGERISQLPVKKGQHIAVAIASYQKFEPVWGSDADQYRPSRWLDGIPCKGQALGPYSHLLSFAGGNRPCPGWRFSLSEMQIILSDLVANFSFAPSPDDPVRPQYAGVFSPVTKEGVKGVPLLVERISHS